MGVSKKIEYDGRIYESITEFVEAHGLHYRNTSRRYKSGWNLEECINPSIRKRPSSRGSLITVNGKSYASKGEAAYFHGIKQQTFSKRLRSGWTPEQAAGVETPPPREPTNVKSCSLLGKTFLSKRARNKYFNLGDRTEDLIDTRIENGWSERQAAGLDSPPHRFRNDDGTKRAGGWLAAETIDGKTYPKTAKGNFKLYVIKNSVNSKEYVGITISCLDKRWRGHCREAFGLNENNKFKNALRKHGKENFSIELIRHDAKNWPELEEQEKVEIKKRDCVKNGYNTSGGGGINSSKPITINGVLYASQTSAAESFEIDDYLFNSRLGAGWSPEQAAGLVDPNKPYSREIRIGDKVYPSEKNACESEGKNYKTVWARIHEYGWTIKQAFDLEAPPKSYEKYQSGNKIKLNEDEFASQRKMAEFLDISPTVITERKNNGESFQSIFDHFKNNGGRRRKDKVKSVEA